MKVALDHPPQLKAVNKTVVMQPVDIAKHIMAIREQLSSEWHQDLGNVEVCLVCMHVSWHAWYEKYVCMYVE